MDERLLEIFKLVFCLNKKGFKLAITLRENSIDIIDSNFKGIVPHWTGSIYLDEYWDDEYDDMVNSTLEMLKEMLNKEDIVYGKSS